MTVDGSIPETSTSISGLGSATKDSPFGFPLDPYQITGDALTSRHNVVLATSYLLSDVIFNYALPGKAAQPGIRTDNLLQLWKDLRRTNLSGQTPDLYNLDVSTGCGNIVLGYLKDAGTASATLVGSTATLQHLAGSILGQKENLSALPVSLQISTVGYDAGSETLISDYEAALDAAKLLKLPVLVSTSAKEAQHFTVLSLALAKSGIANVHLYGGLDAVLASQSVIGLLTSKDLQLLYTKLSARLGDAGIERTSAIETLPSALKHLSEATGVFYEPFQKHGDISNAESVTVVSAADPAAEIVASTDASIVVRVPLPFNIRSFCRIIDHSYTSRLQVLSQSLKLDVQAALFLEGNFKVRVSVLDSIPEETLVEAAHYSKGSSFQFILADDFAHTSVPSELAFGLSMVPGLTVKFRPLYDHNIDAGVFAADIQSGKDFSGKHNVVILQGIGLLNKVDVLKSLKQGGSIVVINPASTKLDTTKLAEAVSPSVKKQLIARNIALQVLDLNSLGEDPSTKGLTTPIAMHVAFWTYAYPDFEVTPMVNKIWNCYGPTNELLPSVILNLVNKVRESGFSVVPVSELAKESSKETDEISLVSLVDTAFAANPRAADEESSEVLTKFDLAKKLVFKEAYGTREELRPDESAKTFIIKVKENRRVTPSDYSRNIFHIEFDISGTGLKYNIGEALGVHGRNNEAEVDAFIEAYGLNSTELVQVERDGEQLIRTVKQALLENVDLLGKPSKKFYKALSEYATEDEEKKDLNHLAAPAGAALLKKYQEDETYSYADVLALFPSAHPSAQELVSLITPLKRREYSIASSQKAHPNEVHLLVVVVDWVDKRGRQRFGQCSKYLSDLKVGDSLVVSVKPSLMKLPPATTQPVVMAGLGTGLAPFKAFIEEREWQRSQGQEIGEIYLYLGSRHKKQEYLYGEYWEAYLNEGILTYLGAAFSRDQKNKIYIQDRIRENLDELVDLVCKKQGHFYLCGPTWPVPDITKCLEDVYEKDAQNKGETIDAVEEVEKMKEEGRYVLEVY